MHINLPNSVCEECVTNIDKLYNFRKVIKDSDFELKVRLQALEKLIQNTEESLVKKEPNDNAVVTIIESDDNENETIKHETDKSDILEKPDHNTACNSDSAKTRISDYLKYKERQNGRSYNCRKCNFTCIGLLPWRKHWKNLHAPRGICNVCGKTMRKDCLEKHVKNHTNGHVCKECGESFKNYVNLKKHIDEHHEGVKLSCKFCGKIFHFRWDYNAHVRNHRKLNIFFSRHLIHIIHIQCIKKL